MFKRRKPGYCSVLSLGIILTGCPISTLAQVDSASVLRATLRDWEEESLLTIFDRSGSIFGRVSERGILQRFNDKMDPEYQLDLISFSPLLSETYDWYQHKNGARAWAGSINHLELVQRAEAKALLDLGESWSVAAHLTQEETLERQRTLLRLGFQHEVLGGRARAFLSGTAKAKKPETDIELGFTWLPKLGRITVALAALDLFSDVIYQGLEVAPNISDTALDYRSNPYTARVALELSLRSGLRLEGYGLVMTPTEVRVDSQSDPGTGFTQDERYAYAGGLIEWAASPRLSIGGFGTWVRARLGRQRLPTGLPEDDFDLREKTWQLGLYGIHRFADRFTAELWATRVWRTEDRTRPDTSVAPNIDYEDRSWSGRAGVVYTARSGFRADLGVDFVAPEVIGSDRVPGPAIRRNHSRLRFDLGWHIGRKALLLLGSNLDLDGDRQRSRSFDGGHGRIVLYW